MSSEDQDRLSALTDEQAKLSKDIDHIYAELKKHAAGFEQVGRKLNEYAEQVVLNKGQVWVHGRPSHFAFPEDLFDIRKVGELTEQLRIKLKRLVEIQAQMPKTDAE